MLKTSIFILFLLTLFYASSCRAETGMASYFSNVETKNKRCADGKYHNLNTELVAASWVYPLGTILRVSSVGNPSTYVDVVVVDRGPGRKDGTSRFYKGKRIIDLSKGAFGKIVDLDRGVVAVQVERINP